MTEGEWLRTESPDQLLTHAKALKLLNNRKARLVACGCFRLVWDRIGVDHVKATVEQAERRADREISQKELQQFSQRFTLAPHESIDFKFQVALGTLAVNSVNAAFLAYQIRSAIGRE